MKLLNNGLIVDDKNDDFFVDLSEFQSEKINTDELVTTYTSPELMEQCENCLSYANMFLDSWNVDKAACYLDTIEACGWADSSTIYQKWLLGHCRIQIILRNYSHYQIFKVLFDTLKITQPEISLTNFTNLELNETELMILMFMENELFYLTYPNLFLKMHKQIPKALNSTSIPDNIKNFILVGDGCAYAKRLILIREYDKALPLLNQILKTAMMENQDFFIYEINFLIGLCYNHTGYMLSADRIILATFFSSHGDKTNFAKLSRNYLRSYTDYLFPDAMEKASDIKTPDIPFKKPLDKIKFTNNSYQEDEAFSKKPFKRNNLYKLNQENKKIDDIYYRMVMANELSSSDFSHYMRKLKRLSTEKDTFQYQKYLTCSCLNPNKPHDLLETVIEAIRLTIPEFDFYELGKTRIPKSDLTNQELVLFYLLMKTCLEKDDYAKCRSIFEEIDFSLRKDKDDAFRYGFLYGKMAVCYMNALYHCLDYYSLYNYTTQIDWDDFPINVKKWTYFYMTFVYAEYNEVSKCREYGSFAYNLLYLYDDKTTADIMLNTLIKDYSIDLAACPSMDIFTELK